MNQPSKISGRISIELSDAQRGRSSKGPPTISALSSALPGSFPTPWPPRFAEPDLEDGVSFRKLKSGSIRTSPKPAVQARAPLLFLGSAGSHAVFAPSPSGRRAQSAPLGRCPLCLSTSCPLLQSHVNFLWDGDPPGLRQASDPPLRLSCL